MVFVRSPSNHWCEAGDCRSVLVLVLLFPMLFSTFIVRFVHSLPLPSSEHLFSDASTVHNTVHSSLYSAETINNTRRIYELHRNNHLVVIALLTNIFFLYYLIPAHAHTANIVSMQLRQYDNQ
jgi:hypothetical protein